MAIITAATAATGFVDMLDIVDFGITRGSEADTTRRLERLSEAIDGLEIRVDQLGDQVFQSAVARVDAARALLANYAPGDPASEAETIVATITRAVTDVLRQADVVMAEGISFDRLVSTVNAVNYAIQTRMLVAASIEDGALGSVGLRGEVERAAALIREAATLRMDPAIRAEIEAETEERSEGGFLGLFETDYIRYTMTSGVSGYEITQEWEKDVFQATAILEEVLVDWPDEIAENDLRAVETPALVTLADEMDRIALGVDSVGTAGADALSGTSGNDYLRADGGADSLDGGAGNDALSGGAGRDTLEGGDGDDQLQGGPGDDVLEGGDGRDIARYPGLAAEYEVTGDWAGATVAGPEGRDRLEGIEALVFDDTQILLARDLTLEERVALAYEAGLDRDGDIDPPGLNFWIDRREGGLGERDMAFAFLESDEFTDKFGDYRAVSDEGLVRQLYRNVLERDGEEAGVAFWTAALAAPGFDEADLLISFSLSTENVFGAPFIDDLTEIAPGEWDFA